MNSTENNTTRMINKISVLVAFTTICMVITGCGIGGNDNSEPEQVVVQTTSTQSHGEVLSDEEGNVLYYFTRDVKGTSNCTGQCVQNWPLFAADAVNSNSGLNPTFFTNQQRSDGGVQTSYKGWPLYYFSEDDQPEMVSGDGENDVWYVAKPNYTLMIADEQLVGHDGENYLVDDNGDYVTGEEITTFLTDSVGRTIYRFIHDDHSTNNFTNDDFSNNSVWPIFYQPIDQLPSSLDEADFDVIEVHGERQQLTYKGWPLYYFGGTNEVEGDNEPGETRGISFPPQADPGVWPIVNHDTPPAPQPQ